MNVQYFDSHAHYDDERFNGDLEDVINSAYKEGVTKILDVGYNEETSKHAIGLAQKYEFIYASVGNHPEYCNKDIDLEFVYKLAHNNKVKAIGEIGLDYHWEHDKEYQKKNFIKQIEIANDLNLPIILHNRDADMDILEILKHEIRPKQECIFHCFSSSLEVAKEVLRNGWNISLSGTVTFKNARNLHEVAKYVPLEKLLIETDCPYLSPEPFRGQRNDSSKVVYVSQKVAHLRGISNEEVASKTYENACRIYKI